MPENKEIALNDQIASERQYGLERLLKGSGGHNLGDGMYSFDAPEVDISASIGRKRQQIAERRLREQEAIRRAGLNPEANVPETPLAEAGFITPRGGDAGFINPNGAPLITYNQPMATYASPGFVEAGHRRPEDINQQDMEAYKQAYEAELTARRKMFL